MFLILWVESVWLALIFVFKKDMQEYRGASKPNGNDMFSARIIQ